MAPSLGTSSSAAIVVTDSRSSTGRSRPRRSRRGAMWRDRLALYRYRITRKGTPMKSGSIGAGLTAWAGALLSSLCCLLPLAVIVLGLGSGAFIAVTMRYRWLLIPAGVIGVTAGFVLYLRERRRGNALGCRMAGRRVTPTPLIVAGLGGGTSNGLDPV